MTGATPTRSRRRQVLAVVVAGLLAVLLWLTAPHRSAVLSVVVIALGILLGAMHRKALLTVVATSPYVLGAVALLAALASYEIGGTYRLVAEDSNGTWMPSVPWPAYVKCYRGVAQPAYFEPPGGVLGVAYHLVRPTVALFASIHNDVVAGRLDSKQLSTCSPNADWASAWKALEQVAQQQGRGWLALSEGATPDIVVGVRQGVQVEALRPKTCAALARNGIPTEQPFVLHSREAGINNIRWMCRDGLVVPAP